MILNNYPHFVKYEWGFFVGGFDKNPDAHVALFHTVNTLSEDNILIFGYPACNFSISSGRASYTDCSEVIFIFAGGLKSFAFRIVFS
jgi:hypothetical protein